ncbi:hypothetical protein DDB_G0291013 [Dictyostelium discoideum AX4]|uniref:TPR-like protein n=1 Tax=Dictyostelium discoideum TaxID=44689 RepID=Q54F85_DICDI|nr:hypothetical protein DDB_G0291013 [Dictyostelium discoideum AX4]EAL61937.1 hypothetical protein DDB_G0291013 [Dictyostelium discoideum AX4]|eukprot:XP_635452.1 hypothetical protein DDB_G0291013 [Dictyostelium discoideum AX4]
MSKPNKAKLQQQKKGKKSTTTATTTKKELTSEEYIQQGEKYASEYHFDKALSSFENALKLDPINTLVMDTIGEILVENGDIENAKTYFLKSIKTDPEDSPSKYMNLGQLVGGDDALNCYRKGIQIMERELKQLIKEQGSKYNDLQHIPRPLKSSSPVGEDDDGEDTVYESDEDDPIIILKQQLCSALCSISELYLTDQCFDDDAEDQCESNLKRAIGYSPNSPEPYSLMASMKISQVKNQEAIEYLNKSYQLWEHSDIDDRPEFDYRFNISLLFIELKENRTAVDILEQLVNEQDNIAELWYTLGVVYNNLNEPLSAQECLITSKELLKIAAPQGRDEELEHLTNTLLKKVEIDVSKLSPEEIEALNNDNDEDEAEQEEMDE